ncbi:asparagine synthase (glutamine-hydrolyzing) [Candidatus Woesearchaeota archaeon]|nr:asparagine synthase (glutamine-hydrolyzing) [Candidatus Woesearchaeota archaeon]
MCGINGILALGKRPSKLALVNAPDIRIMSSLMGHRGPDSSGAWISPDKRAGLGHTRLSIIDLSPKGNQPMALPDKSVWIVFNGEIYNYIELREKLSEKGHEFKSGSDTEILLHLYNEYGASFIPMLKGMFAFCIYDSKKRKALLARDRMGKKPLIYYHERKNGRFWFASEIEAVVKASRVKKEIDLDALNHYFSHCYFHVPAPYTIFKNVRKLEPACQMEVDLESGAVRVLRYWRPVFREINEPFQSAMKKYLEKTKENVSIRERSDVPIALTLSGGVDSSTILNFLDRKNLKDLTVYSIGHDKNDIEIKRARKVARLFGVKMKALYFKDAGLKDLPLLIRRAGEPFNLPSALYSLQINSQIRKDKIKVVLNGNGADEMFCGYDHHNEFLLLTKIAKLKKVFGTWFFRILDGMVNRDDARLMESRLGKFIRFMTLPDESIKSELYRIHQKMISGRMYSERFRDGVHVDVGRLVDNYVALTESDDFFKRNFYCDLALVNAHSMTYISDVTGMAHSIEIRSPFMDHEMLEFAGSLPNRYKIRSYFSKRKNKYIMKKAAERFLPTSIVYGKKMGFGYNIKIHEMLRKELRREAEKRLLSGCLKESGLFNMDEVKRMFTEHVSEDANHGIMLMALISFEEWYRQFMRPAGRAVRGNARKSI